jgi:hypothetical protein
MKNKKIIYGFIASVAVFLLAVCLMRIFSLEDSWICKDGKWVKHGEPSSSQPVKECR